VHGALEARVRSIHAQDRPAEWGAAGQRCALALAGLEKAESARQTADLLHGRVADLEGQLRDMQRLLVLKDTQLAQLQQRAEEALKAASLAMAKAEAEAAAAAAQRRAEMPAASAVSVEAGRAEPSPAAAAKPAEPIAAPMVPAQAASPSEAATPGEVAKPAAPAAPAEVVRSEPPLAPHEPVDQGKAPQPTGVAGLLSDPANVLGAGIAGLGVLGALLWAMVGRRRSSAREAAIPAETVEPIAAAGATAPEPGPDLAPAGAAAAAAEPAAAPVAMAGTVPVAVAAAVAEEVDRVPTEDLAALQVSTTDLFGLKGDTTEVDPAEEADVYVAYGRYEQAEQLLRLALEMEPNRLPLQHKLLEVYAASRDATAFNGLFRELLAAGKDAEDPTAWEQAVRMGRQIDPANPLYGAGEAVDASALDDELGRMGRELDGDLDRLAAGDGDLGDLGLKPQTGGVGLDAIDTGSVLNDLSLDLGTEDLGLGKSSHPFNLDVTEELKGSGGSVGGVGEIDAGEALAWGQGKTDASGLVEGEIAPVEVVAEQLDDAARDVPDLGDIDLGPDTVMDLGADTTLAHSDTTLELVDDVETKLDLARAYVELGDQESARLMLEEAMHEGNPAQRAAAEALLKELG
jgi:pilus assembly protein FimV